MTVSANYENPGIVTVGNTAVTLEGEDYRNVTFYTSSSAETYCIPDTNILSNGADGEYIRMGSLPLGYAYDGIRIDMPINVSQAGTYKITWRVMPHSNNNAPVSLRVGENNVQTLGLDSTATTTANPAFIKTYEMSVNLAAGVTSVGLQAKATNVSGTRYLFYAVDYIKIESVSNPGTVDVGASPVTLEGEDYRLITLFNSESDKTEFYTATKTEDDVTWAYNGSNATYQHARIDMPINVKIAGNYKITYRVRPSFTGCNVNLCVGGVNVRTLPQISDASVIKAENLQAFEYTTFFVPGETSVGVYAQGNAAKYHMYAVDYIKIECVDISAPVEVDGSTEKTLEYEDYMNMSEKAFSFTENFGLKATDATLASGGKYVEPLSMTYEGLGGTDRNTSFGVYIPINVTESGMYTVTFTASKPVTAENGSKLSLKLDTDELFNNETSEGIMVSSNYPSAELTMYKFEKVVELTAGLHNLSTIITCPTGQDSFSFAIDSISFKPTMLYPQILSWIGNNVSASVYVRQDASVLSGKNVVIILAWYDENNTMLGMNPIPDTIYTQTETINVGATVAANAVKARLFVWEGTSVSDAGTKSLIKAVTLSK